MIIYIPNIIQKFLEIILPILLKFYTFGETFLTTHLQSLVTINLFFSHLVFSLLQNIWAYVVFIFFSV